MFEGLLMVLGGIALIALALLYHAFAWGIVCWKFWYWFLLPVFPTLPEVTLIQCVGLMMFVGLFHDTPLQVIKEEYVDNTKKNWITFLTPLIALFLGWLIKIIIVH